MAMDYSRPVETLWLPGDRVAGIDSELRRAIRRDSRMTPKEAHVAVLVRACRRMEQNNHWWRCNPRSPCVFCQEVAEV